MVTTDSIAGEPEQAAWQMRDAVVAGVSNIGGAMTSSCVTALRPELVPLVWASPRATSGGKSGLAGTLPVPGWIGGYGRGRVSIWAGHEGFFGAGADGRLDNDIFRENLLVWLLDGGTRVGVSTGHNEWLSLDRLSPVLIGSLAKHGVAVEPVPVVLTLEALQEFDALVIGNPWGEFTAEEITALERWVAGGKGLLVLGLGWSWYENHDDPSGAQYPVNRLGEVFGWRVENGQINDPDTPEGDAGEPAYLVRPLAEYQPGRVIVLSNQQCDVDSVKQLAISQPRDIFVIQGKYMGLQLPTAKWVLLDSPSQAVDTLDRAYETQLELVGSANRPYNGDLIWYASADDPAGAYWMHSGNPIIYKQEAADEIIKSLNAGWPGWGMLHELGHNFVISACGNLFVHSRTGEPWCNVFTVWSIEQNGWPEHRGAFDAGHKLHQQEQADLAQITGDPWPLLGCLEIVWSRYGWEGLQRFMTRAAQDCAAGVVHHSDAERTDYFAVQLSQAYQLDLTPVLRHWGFAVSVDAAGKTAAFAPAQL